MTNLAFDREYKLKRAEKRAGMSDSSPGVLGGLGAAGRTATGGLFDGIKGLVDAPVKGAQRGGLMGGIKGAGKGMVGFVVKPVVGISDAATDVLQGIKGTTAQLEGGTGRNKPFRVRPQRALYGHARTLRPYVKATHALSRNNPSGRSRQPTPSPHRTPHRTPHHTTPHRTAQHSCAVC